MAVSRRKFLGIAAGAVIGASELAHASTAVAATTRAAPGRDKFQSAVGTLFRFRVGASYVNLRLTKVTDAPADPRASSMKGEAFSLAFDGGGKKVARFAQGTYSVQHATLGAFSLFVAPSTPQGQAPVFGSDINRRVPRAA
jgi:hypothetical protein